MSTESIAALRKHGGEELAQLAEQHLQHDLQPSDREALNTAARKLSTHATIGSVVGLGLGILLAVRIRRARSMYFKTFRAIEKPTHVQFADGRLEPLPDLTPLLKPTTLGDIAAYTFFSAGGLFIGGELGLLSGSWGASRTISSDQESRKRIEYAFRSFRADVLRKQAEDLDKGSHMPGPLGL